MKIYLTTDTHFSHSRVIEFGRPKNYERLIKKHLHNLPKIDMFIHLGDICIGEDKINNNWFRFIKAKRILVRGNHDRKSNSWYMNNGRDIVCERFDFKLNGKTIAFTHAPIPRDGIFDINIHGHLHDTGRDNDPRVNGYNKLLALEHTNYKPVELEKFLNT